MTRPPIKGPARAQRDAFIAARTGRALSRAVEERLFGSAEVLSEGDVRTAGDGERHYHGSTMITFDLERLRAHWRGELDLEGQRELAHLVAGSVRMRLRAMRLACAEVARRVTDRPLGTVFSETTVRLQGSQLQMDVDLEVQIGVCSPARRTP